MKLKSFIIPIVSTILVITGVIIAGQLTPPSAPAPTMYTLSDIYNLIENNATTTAGNHTISTSSSPLGSMYSLTDIYTSLSTLIDASKVVSGTTYLGVAGTANAPIVWEDQEVASSTWDNAVATCVARGSRLPTLTEAIQSLTDGVSGFPEIVYWSSDSNSLYGLAYYYNGSDRYIGFDSKTAEKYVRCVH